MATTDPVLPSRDAVERVGDVPFAQVNPHAPPALYVHGTADAPVPYHQSQDLVAELTAAGVECELLTLPDAPHTPLMHMDQIIAGIAQFLHDRCR